MADMLSESPEGTKHKDLRPSEVQKSEKNVVKALDAISSFVNPYEVEDQNKLYCLSSGAPFPKSVEIDVLRAEAAGKEAKEEYIKHRLEKKENFFAPVKRLNLESMLQANKKLTLKSNPEKVIEFKSNKQMLHSN